MHYAWAEFGELFGQPIRIGKTDIHDKERKSSMKNMLENMGRSAYALFHSNDQIELVQAGQTDAYQVFEAFLRYADEQISKLFIGQTMTSDDGSSRSQAEVHASIFDEIITSQPPQGGGDRELGSDPANGRPPGW